MLVTEKLKQSRRDQHLFSRYRHTVDLNVFVFQRCVHRANGEAARCMLHIAGGSEPAVNIDTYIHMHRLHAGRYLFRLQRHIIVHSRYVCAHTHSTKGEKEQDVYE